ncbi:endonuclease III [Lactobacillus sp. XV13L]|nr:endonuclease III [Lactobacillus sp. XV13L]
MLKRYGAQHWWPAENEYEIIVGAILVQNTNWRNVDHSLDNLRQRVGFDPQAILALEIDELKDLIRPSGFYNAKAQTIHATLQFMAAYDFALEQINAALPGDRLRTSLLEIKGIGNETADDMLLYVFDRPVFIADAYARRMIARLEQCDVRTLKYMTVKKAMEEKLADFTLNDFQEFHALIDAHSGDYLKDNVKNTP